MRFDVIRFRHAIAAVATTAFLAGLATSCMDSPDIQTIRTVNYGPSVFLWEAQERVQSKLAKRVTFPDSASNWTWSELRRGWVVIGVLGEPAYGWILKGSASYRNIVGGRSRHSVYCLFRNGRVLRTWDGSEVNVEWGYVDDPTSHSSS